MSGCKTFASFSFLFIGNYCSLLHYFILRFYTLLVDKSITARKYIYKTLIPFFEIFYLIRFCSLLHCNFLYEFTLVNIYIYILRQFILLFCAFFSSMMNAPCIFFCVILIHITSLKCEIPSCK